MPIQTASQALNNESGGSPFGFKNRIVNGAMLIDQRKAGSVLTDSGFTNKPGCVDMWYLAVGSSATGTTAQQVSDAPTGFAKSLKFTGRTSSVTQGAGNWDAILTSVEGYNIADLGWGAAGASPITISFWVKGSVATTMSLSVYNGGSSDNAPSSASISRCYVTTYTINQVDTWEYKTITIPGPTSGTWNKDNGIGLTVYFNLNSGSNYTGTTTNAWETVAGTARVQTSATATNYMVLGGNKTFQLTGVQLEKGSTATSFDYRPYTTELQLCQRYCFVDSYDGNNGTSFMGYWSTNTNVESVRFFPIEMRSAPTLTVPTIGALYALEPQTAWRAASGFSANETNTKSGKWSFTCATNSSWSSTGRTHSVLGLRSSGQLIFSSEL